jgi:propane monooxygenase coupling protein
MSNSKTHAAGAASVKTARNRVGISFMVSADTEAIVELTRDKYPDAQIDFRDCFYKVEREGSLDWGMEDVGERLGGRSTPISSWSI